MPMPSPATRRPTRRVRDRVRRGGGRAGPRRGVLLLASSSRGVARPQERERRSERRKDRGGHRVGCGAGGVHCVEMAQVMGARHEQILGSIHLAVNAQTSGDIMAHTAGAAPRAPSAAYTARHWPAARKTPLWRPHSRSLLEATAPADHHHGRERRANPWSKPPPGLPCMRLR